MSNRISRAEYNDRVARSWDEATFQATLVRRARELGWLVQHSRKAKTPQGHRTPITGDKGYPDLTLAKAGRLIIAELKTETGTVTPEQRRWIEALCDDEYPILSAAWVDGYTDGTGILDSVWDYTGTHRTLAIALWRPRHWDTITGLLADA